MHKIGPFIKSVGNQLSYWKKTGAVTLPDLRAKMSGWVKDMENLSDIGDVAESPKFCEAQEAMARAWNVRDSKKSAIEYVTKAYECLKDMASEAPVDDEPVDTKLNTKTKRVLFGAKSMSLDAKSPIQAYVDDASRRLNSFVISGNYSRQTIKAIKSDFIEIYNTTLQSEMRENINRFLVHLDNVERETGAVNVRSHVKAAVDVLPRILSASFDYYTPDRVQSANADTAREAMRYVKAAREFLTSNLYIDDYDEILGNVRNQVTRIKSIASNYYEPKLQRVVDNTIKAVEQGYNVASSPKVKSAFNLGVMHRDVSENIENIINKLDQIEDFFRNI